MRTRERSQDVVTTFPGRSWWWVGPGVQEGVPWHHLLLWTLGSMTGGLPGWHAPSDRVLRSVVPKNHLEQLSVLIPGPRPRDSDSLGLGRGLGLGILNKHPRHF